jgi:tRNA A-37 threonylcarbamoyl transferase component Bud32
VIGETIGHFEIVARAGRGGMGEVFIAEHATIKTRVAIKVLHAHVSANADHVHRFFNEARAAARIPHAGIVKIFDVGFHVSQRAYLIMEYLDGETLAARLARTGRLSPRSTLEIARQIASVLDATHHAGIVHRDLKPENVFLVPDRELASGERIKLLDFGIAKLSDTLGGTGPTTVGAIGTPSYMAPEQWSNARTIDWRADVYSLGCILYQMVAGRPPFVSKSIADACAQHLHEAPRPLRDHAPEVPASIDALALRLLAKDPALRAASTADLQHELTELALEAAGAPAISDDLPPQHCSDPAKRSGMPGHDGAVGIDMALSSASTTARPRGNWRVAAGIAVTLVLAIAALVVPRGAPPARPSPLGPAIATLTTPAGPSNDAASADPELPFVTWLEAANPFVAWRGAHWLAHQVTRREYRRFLESLSVSDALRFQPMTGWDDGDAMRPVAWVTFERAEAFCRAIHARLPASDQWRVAAQGAWGLDPTGVGALGPLREWTSTVRGGLVVVCGGHARMSPAEQEIAASNPLMKSNEAQAGPSPARNIVASETIGFRCVR